MASAVDAGLTGGAEVNAPVPYIAWEQCEGQGLEAFQCATADVPRDYDEPDGDSIPIALTKLPAQNQAERIGSAFLNFGGPGGAGVSTLHALGGEFLGKDTANRFDLIGFDPRGVGQSDPATCFPDAESELEFSLARGPFPIDDPAAESDYIAETAKMSFGCALLSNERIESASTANVARDLDLLRQAVGDEKLTYVGYSYGTLLGATYSALFPDRVRALVLDGTVDPRTWFGQSGSIGNRLGMGPVGLEAFEQFKAECVAAGPDACSLAALGDPGEITDAVFESLKEEPLVVPIDETTSIEVTYPLLVNAIISLLYSPQGFPLIADVISDAYLRTTDQPVTKSFGSESIGDILREWGLIEDYPSVGAMMGAACTDSVPSGDPWSYTETADAADEEAPDFGRARNWWGIECEFISFQDDDAYMGPWDQQVASPVLVIGTRYDPATAYSATKPYADLYPDGRMMTVEGYGHTSLGVSTCATEAISDYLVNLEATDGAVCQQDAGPFDAPPPALTPGVQDTRVLMSQWGL